MEERPAIWRVSANILKKQSRVAEMGCSSRLGVGRGAKNSFPLKRNSLRNIHRQSLGPGLILCYDLSNERGTGEWVIKSRRIRWAGRVARMEQGRGLYRVLVGKSEGKRPLGRPGHRWEDNIKMYFQ